LVRDVKNIRGCPQDHKREKIEGRVVLECGSHETVVHARSAGDHEDSDLVAHHLEGKVDTVVRGETLSKLPGNRDGEVFLPYLLWREREGYRGFSRRRDRQADILSRNDLRTLFKRMGSMSPEYP